MNGWRINGGATEHMTDKRHYFKNIRTIAKRKWQVTLLDDQFLDVARVGDINIMYLVKGS